MPINEALASNLLFSIGIPFVFKDGIGETHHWVGFFKELDAL
ncbi:hypothetical protein [Methylomonas methanica]|nr:hypothetical protein [Methylomonas methanica]